MIPHFNKYKKTKINNHATISKQTNQASYLAYVW